MDWNSDTFKRVVKIIGDFDTNYDISEKIIELIGDFDAKSDISVSKVLEALPPQSVNVLTHRIK